MMSLHSLEAQYDKHVYGCQVSERQVSKLNKTLGVRSKLHFTDEELRPGEVGYLLQVSGSTSIRAWQES